MLLFFDFDRLLWGHTIGTSGQRPGSRECWTTSRRSSWCMIRWTVGTLRTIDDVRGEVPELGDHIKHCGAPVQFARTSIQSARSPARCAG